MLNLERFEKIAVSLLISGLLLGIGVMAYRKSCPAIDVSVSNFGAIEETRGKININDADAAAFAGLKGIGPALAERIIRYRDQNGRFGYIDEIKKVKGIGDSLFAKIKDEISVE